MRSKFIPKLSALVCLVVLSLFTTKIEAQCIPAFGFGCSLASIVTGDDINTFTLSGASSTSINDIATGCSGGYDDRTSESVTMNPGSTYNGTINMTSDLSGSGANIQIFIDFNNDGTFASSESVGGLASVGSAPGTTPYTITIPAGAATGNHRMRVVLCSISDAAYPSISPCAYTDIIITTIPYSYGEVHDYTANISTSSTTTCPPVTGLGTSALTSSSVVLNWTAAAGAIGYEWAVTTSATPPASGTATTLTTATASGLTASTFYYAYVRTKCSATSFSSWVSVTFTTLAATTTCTAPTLTLGAGTSTTQVVNWTAVTGATGYEWVVDMSSASPTGSGTATTLTTFTATSLTPSTAYYAHVRTNCGTGFSTWTTIPFTTGASTTTCDTVTGLTMSAITATSAVLNWTAVAGASGYEWLVNTTAGAPGGAGTATTLTTATATGLTPATTYYPHVRTSCGTTFSSWVTTPSFVTLSTGCAPVTLLTASAITTTTATISWTAVSGSIGYIYVVDNLVSGPASAAGTFTTLTSASITGLTAGTTYYAHVRDSCAVGSVSTWVTVPISTLTVGGCNPVTSLTATGIASHSATINWVRATGAVGAEYVVNTIAADPTGAGTGTTALTYNATGLTASTTYYAHVRDSCGATSLSAWVTIPLITLSGIKNITAGDFNVTAYPNPVREEFTVKIDGSVYGNAQVQLIDITGKLLRTVVVTGNVLTVDMNGVPSGIYLVRYIDAEHTQTIKVNKQ